MVQGDVLSLRDGSNRQNIRSTFSCTESFPNYAGEKTDLKTTTLGEKVDNYNNSLPPIPSHAMSSTGGEYRSSASS